mmetsp:Transcript_58488/g.187887  ORF Transcript_58488/g.187887 Transcript_58488/m.187887 type:complete len:348 (+) Transcript_58488:79-1122(+)
MVCAASQHLVRLVLIQALGLVVGQPALLDDVALIQKDTRSHEAVEAPQPFGIFSGLGNGGAGGLGNFLKPQSSNQRGAQLPFPAPKAPDMEQIMKAMKQFMDVLRNRTVVAAMVEMMDNMKASVINNTASLNRRYAELGKNVEDMPHAQIKARTASFMKNEIELMLPDALSNMKALTKMVKAMPLGNHSRQVRLAVAMAEPMLTQALSQFLDPLIASTETLGNGTEVAFCEKLEPFVRNSTTALEYVQKGSDGLKEAAKTLPQLKTSPLVFMMPDVVPALTSLGESMIGLGEANLDYFRTQFEQENTTLRAILYERMDCKTLQSGTWRVGTSLLVAAATAVAWLAGL